MNTFVSNSLQYLWRALAFRLSIVFFLNISLFLCSDTCNATLSKSLCWSFVFMTCFEGLCLFQRFLIIYMAWWHFLCTFSLYKWGELLSESFIQYASSWQVQWSEDAKCPLSRIDLLWFHDSLFFVSFQPLPLLLFFSLLTLTVFSRLYT